MIKAPFNFVPVSDKVFFPDWADQISHDIPFSDGESGEIELKITAESPIFVRNGHTKADGEAKNDTYKSFSKVDNRYFIPATTIKGAIRNVLEIMSFGKMRLDKNAMFAQREWGNPQLYTIKNPQEQANLHCGYLRRKDDDFEIIDCGKPYRIAMVRIDEKTQMQILANEFKQTAGAPRLSDEQKTAKYKYNLLKKHNNIFGINSFSKDIQYACEYKENRVMFNSNGNIRGRLVLTGSPDRYKFPRPQRLDAQAGKFYEFVFPVADEGTIPFSKEEWEHFKFIYKDSDEWDRMKRLIESRDGDGIPVFFRKDNDDIKDLGMAFLYKLPYENSPFDTLKDNHKQDGGKNRDKTKRDYKADLSDCLFGFTDDNGSLKGRVHVSHAFSDAVVVPVAERIVTLGSPKASYYPLYIKQSTEANGTVVQYATYNANGQISGWKRYMIRESLWGIKNKDEYNQNLDTIILPLDNNTAFTFKIRYHNLKKAELGALLSAITYHNTTDCRYQIGQGKPYGFGKVRMEIVNFEEKKLCDFLYEFEKAMVKHCPDWAQRQQIKELLTLTSKPVASANSSSFEYLKMSNTSAQNEFLTVKGGQRGNGAKEGLRSYSSIIGSATDATSLYSSRIRQEYDELVNEAKTLKEQEKYTEAKEKLEKAESLSNDGLTAEHEAILKDINAALQKQQERDVQAKIDAEQVEKDRAKVEGGLAFLDEKFPDGDKYKVTDFKGAKSRIDQWLKKANRSDIPPEQYNVLKTTIDRLRQNKKNAREDWTNFDSSIWKAIKSFVGEETAKQWFRDDK
ncbi:MAG: TIGR03986 family CRISPR-associated RAMP protein [Bacteroidales bacterium]|jgi:CRISPR-associated protein (TIGR03986 family)|nr:TIGR03986 family CRISPR-associated RAMP protein [Bacteroidales bacterium]